MIAKSDLICGLQKEGITITAPQLSYYQRKKLVEFRPDPKDSRLVVFANWTPGRIKRLLKYQAEGTRLSRLRGPIFEAARFRQGTNITKALKGVKLPSGRRHSVKVHPHATRDTTAVLIVHITDEMLSDAARLRIIQCVSFDPLFPPDEITVIGKKSMAWGAFAALLFGAGCSVDGVIDQLFKAK